MRSKARAWALVSRCKVWTASSGMRLPWHLRIETGDGMQLQAGRQAEMRGICRIAMHAQETIWT